METADVCIVGGGLLGTATALYAARAGLKVILLEERSLASGASGAAFGGVSVGIYSYASARVPDWYVDISKTSLQLYAALQQELGPPMDLLAPGSIDPFYEEKGFAAAQARAAGLRECGVPCEVLDRYQVQAIEPAISDAIAGATYCPIDAHVTPLCAVEAFADGARRAGADLRTGVRVTALIRQGDRITGVRTAAGDIASHWVVNLAGIGAVALAETAGVRVPLDMSRGQMFVTERMPKLLRTYIHNIKQSHAGTIVIGATREAGLTDTGTTVAGTKEVLSWAMRLLPALANVNVLRSWSGIRPVPPDGYPIIGPVDGVEGLLLSVMHRGVTLAPVVGRSLTELMTEGRSSCDLSPYHLSRFAALPVDRDGHAPEGVYGHA